jgi:hypothetical protein
MKKFSARKGYKPVKSTIQINSIDDELQNSLWNNLIEHYFYDYSFYYSSLSVVITF